MDNSKLTVDVGGTSTFDIINGPDGKPPLPASDTWHEGSRITRGSIVFSIVGALAIAGGIYVMVTAPRYTAAALLGVMIMVIAGALLAKAVNSRAARKRTWLENEIELSWFRSLNNMPDGDGNLDWDVWERNLHPEDVQQRINEYERGFRDGYARGLQDGS